MRSLFHARWALFTLLFVLLIGGSLLISDTHADSPEGTSTPTSEGPTAEPTDETTSVEASEEGTPVPEGGEPAGESTDLPDATSEAPVAPPEAQAPESDMEIMGPQTYCQLDIDDNDAVDDDPFTYVFSAVNTAGIDSYSWVIDGAAGPSGPAATSVTHTFPSTGSYVVELTCDPIDPALSDMVLTGTIQVISMPVANFSVSPATTGFSPFTVDFYSTSTGEGLSYTWEVVSMPAGAGPFSTYNTEDATYTFTVVGSYTVRLSVVDGAGNPSIAEQTIAVNALPPEADFTITPPTGEVPLTVELTGIDNGEGPITIWEWDFDDDSAFDDATGIGPHNLTFNTSGSYWVRLRVTGPGGDYTVSRQVYVAEATGSLTAGFTEYSRTNIGDDVEVCFENTSEGPVATSYWDFDDGTGVIEDNSPIVCHLFVSPSGIYDVHLRVVNAADTADSNIEHPTQVVGAPVAAFNVSAAEIIWQQTVDFTNTSSGVIDTYSWDFDGDGIEDSASENPSGIAIGNISGALKLGANPVRLTVTGPGGTSYVEAIITVLRLELSCDAINGLADVLPGAGLQSYSASVSNIGGRTLNYNWTVTSGEAGFPQSFTTDAFDITWPAAGTYVISLNVESPADGASCNRTKTVSVMYPALNCTMNGDAAVLPDGVLHTYTANVAGDAGRTMTYEWFVDGISVQGPDASNTYQRSWTVDGDSEVVSYVATADDGSYCDEPITVTASWPTLTCSISGNTTPRPSMPSDSPPLEHTYTASYGGDAGRTLTYAWLVDGIPAGTGPTLDLTWDWTNIGDMPQIDLTIVADNGVGAVPATANCTAVQVQPTVTLPSLSCGVPTGDSDPSLGESVDFGRSLNNRFGRPWSTGDSATATFWDFRQSDGAGGWIDIDVDATGDIYNFVFDEADAVYQVRYTVNSVLDPVESCTSSWLTVTAAGTGSDFLCVDYNSGDNSPTDPAANYTYRFDIDNTNGINLEYTWVLVDSTGSERELDTTTSPVDNFIDSPAFGGDVLGPIGDYELRVDVKALDPADSSHSCSMQTDLAVGTFSVDFTYTGVPAAIEVGQEVCFDNTSDTSHDGIDGLTYEWDFGTADNSLGAQFTTLQEPGCVRFNSEGTYAVRLTGTNSYGTWSDVREVVFSVWETQSILISRDDSYVFAGETLGFSATGVNINTYTWNIYRISSGARVGPADRNGTSITQYFSTAGQYRVEVVGNGPLGNTTAELQFELIDPASILAAFSPTRYAGIADLVVCFNDNSVGTNLVQWEWDFGNGDTLTYTDADIPSTICTTYTDTGVDYNVHLRVTNSLGTTADATNQIHTYTPMEAQTTFTVRPQSGSRYCFTAVLPDGVSVTSWDFGDGDTGGAENNPCHNYGASGTYVVTMHITDGVTPGKVIRVIVVNTDTGVPEIAARGVCVDSAATFSVENTGDPMATADEVIVRNAAGETVLIDTLQLGAGETRDYTVTELYGDVFFTVLDFNINFTVNCALPDLTVEGFCDGDTATFRITNHNGVMASPQSYEIRSPGATVGSGDFQLDEGEAPLVITVPNAKPNTFYEFSSSGTYGTLAATHACGVPEADESDEEATTGFSGVGGSGMPVWRDVAVCGPQCPTFRIYHTDETGDWEIFRLDGADAEAEESYRVNLSLGVGEGVSDMAPSLSPNSEWIVFTSNRDTEPGEPENWEIYVAPTSGNDPDQIQRVTYNTIAIDADPVWGPNNYVVFETTRNGNWDLYAVDMTTGVIFPLTDDPTDEINPFWSQDGSRLVYQSNAEGFWQLYELDLYSLQVRRLSDGQHIDVDPQYSPDNRYIAYRSYTNDGDDSVIKIMDIDGQNPIAITEPGEHPTNHAWSPDSRLIAYQSDRDGDLDIYIYEVGTGLTRQLTDNDIPDYAPTWHCSGDRVVFTSDIMASPDIFEAGATPISDPAIRVEEDADRLTFEVANDIYPQHTPFEENASREGRTVTGTWGEQTSFLHPAVEQTNVDVSWDGVQRDDWLSIEVCAID
ncbi:MAG: PKD domain-containing protein [Chloroflexi bacterium]|nr:PKD domain-containing protein [Chloroflexota bacterium]